jgi:hypothetical protein
MPWFESSTESRGHQSRIRRWTLWKTGLVNSQECTVFNLARSESPPNSRNENPGNHGQFAKTPSGDKLGLGFSNPPVTGSSPVGRAFCITSSLVRSPTYYLSIGTAHAFRCGLVGLFCLAPSCGADSVWVNLRIWPRHHPRRTGLCRIFWMRIEHGIAETAPKREPPNRHRVQFGPSCSASGPRSGSS